jgi:ribonuclease HI
MQNLVYAILMTKRKLQHYFDAHPITMVSKYPLREVIQNPEADGRIAKWVLELMGQNIAYAPRSAIKSQVLADFVAEWTENQTPPMSVEHETWIMYFDGSVMKEGACVGLVFISSLGVCMEYLVRLHFPASNNAVKYEALINGLRIAVELGIKRLEIRRDSELVVDQVMKDKNCVDLKMEAYCQAVRDLEGKFHGLELHHVQRDYNKAADVLTKTASSRSPVPHGDFASDQHAPYVRAEGEKPPEEEGPKVMAVDQPPEPNLEDPDWRFTILEWLVEGSSPPTRWRLDASPGEQKCSSSSTVNFTSVEPPAFSCSAFSETRVASCCKRYMPAPVVTMPVQEHLSGRLSNKVSIGPQRSQTPTTSCGVVKGASSTLDKLTFRRRRFRLSPSHGLLPSGTSTWWAALTNTRGLYLPSRGGRQVLQVDRGSTHHQRPLRGGSDILHRHHSSLRHTQHDHHRQ